jgi:hypothetical protein
MKKNILRKYCLNTTAVAFIQIQEIFLETIKKPFQDIEFHKEFLEKNLNLISEIIDLQNKIASGCNKYERHIIERALRNK